MLDYKIIIIGKNNGQWKISTFCVPARGFTNGNCLEYELAKAAVDTIVGSHDGVRYFPMSIDDAYYSYDQQYMFDEGLSFHELVEDYING